MGVIKQFKKAEIKDLLKEDNLLEFNRDIQPKHVDKMINSVRDCGVLRLPVIGNVEAFDKRKRVIVDGQHLCKALVSSPRGSHSVIDVIVKDYTSKMELIDDISKLNNTQKTWTDENYLEAWFKYGRDNYTYYNNYNKLYSLYTDKYDGLACGFLVNLYAVSKNSFREGQLEFRNEAFSDKLAELCYELKIKHNKATFALHGLRIWAFTRLSKKKDIVWVKLRSRIMLAIKDGKDKSSQGREDFRDFVQAEYTRL